MVALDPGVATGSASPGWLLKHAQSDLGLSSLLSPFSSSSPSPFAKHFRVPMGYTRGTMSIRTTQLLPPQQYSIVRTCSFLGMSGGVESYAVNTSVALAPTIVFWRKSLPHDCPKVEAEGEAAVFHVHLWSSFFFASDSPLTHRMQHKWQDVTSCLVHKTL